MTDQVWQRPDPDVCNNALNARKAKLVASACVARPVPESRRVVSLGPFTWMTFTRHPVDLDVQCPKGIRHDSTKVTPLSGIGILQIPARCQATWAGWRLFAETKSTADAAQMIYPHEIPHLLEALKDTAKDRRVLRSQV